MKQIDLREGARRQHRMLAVFAVLQCWLRCLDGVVLKKTHLQRILGLKRFKRTRVNWLREDLREFFPYQTVFWVSGKMDAEGELNSFACLWVCRRTLEGIIPQGEMSTEKRLAALPSSGPQLKLLTLWPESLSKETQRAFTESAPFLADTANYDERLLTSYLSLLCSGQIDPRSLDNPREKA